LMPRLVMPDFQLAIVAFLTGSTFATQISEAWEVGEEMEIDLWRAVNEVGTRVEETLDNWPLQENQTDSSAREKAAKIWEVLMVKVNDSPPRSQLEGTPSIVVESIIEPPHDPVE
jgi:hypothetical protein